MTVRHTYLLNSVRARRCSARMAGLQLGGYTTMELVIVMALLGILAGIALPSTQLLATVRADMAKRRGLYALQYAQGFAMSRSLSTWVRFEVDSDLCSAFREQPNNPGLAGRVPLADPLSGGPLVIDLGQLGADVQGVSFGGGPEVEFDAAGVPRVPGGAPLGDSGVVKYLDGGIEVVDGTGLVRWIP